MNTNFAAVAETIKNRRSIKPAMMNGQKIPDEQVRELLELANWAPNHGNTQPWYVLVYDKPEQFCQQHADLYKLYNRNDAFNPATFNNLTHMGDKVSHIILAVMQRGDLPKIPVVEEIAAASAAIQNIMLGATALGIASFWSTGGMASRPEMEAFLQLGEQDKLMGILYLGYADEIPEGKRKLSINERATWM